MTSLDGIGQKIGARIGRTWFGFIFILTACGFVCVIATTLLVEALASGSVPCPGVRCRGDVSQFENPVFFWSILVAASVAALFILGVACLYAVRFLRNRFEP